MSFQCLACFSLSLTSDARFILRRENHGIILDCLGTTGKYQQSSYKGISVPSGLVLTYSEPH